MAIILGVIGVSLILLGLFVFYLCIIFIKMDEDDYISHKKFLKQSINKSEIIEKQNYYSQKMIYK